MLQAVVALLPEPHASQLRALWKGLDDRFGIASDLTATLPHFSLHVAERYGEELRGRLEAFGAQHPPLRVRTNGLGLFTTHRTILYVPLVRNPRLNTFHREVWRAASGLGAEVKPYYRPERWLPHLTLAHAGLDQYNLGGAIHWLSDQRLDWVFDVDAVSLIEADGDVRREVFRVPLTGEPDKDRGGASQPQLAPP